MQLRFTKMHGLGNDFMVVDAVSQKIRVESEWVRRLADRNLGVGFDQLLVVEPPTVPDMDFRYRIFNADGSEVEHCGNGARCFALFVRDKGLIVRDLINVQTACGQAVLRITEGDQVEVDMGQPMLEPEDIPLEVLEQQSSYSLRLDSQGSDLQGTSTGEISFGALSMGNPHAVISVESVEDAPVERLGRAIQQRPEFPQSVNVGFMEVIDRNTIKLRVYERGVGETLACGTGACAAVVSGQLQGILDKVVKVHLPGGLLQISWQGIGTSVLMTGPATTVYEGQIYL